MSAPTRPAFDELAVDIVVIERVPMRLRGADRIEALRRLTAKGLQPDEIAALLRTSANSVSQLQSYHQITPAPARAWWSRL